VKRLLIAIFGVACAPLPPRGPAPRADAAGPVPLVALPAPGPVTYVEVVMRAGSAFDPVGQEGLAALTARALREGGAGGRGPEEVEALLMRLGTDVEVQVSHELVRLRTRALHEDLPELLPLLADMLLKPDFDADAVSRLKDAQIEALKTGVLEDDEALGAQAFDSLLYEGHPYGHPVDGRWGALSALEAGALEAFHADRHVRGGAVLGVAGPAVGPDGALDPQAPGGQALVELRAALGVGLPGRPVDPSTPRRVPAVEGRELLVIEKPTAGVGVHLGHPTGLHRGHPDWPAMLVAMTAFGEHRQSHGRLYKALRGERGLNYGDYAYIERYVQEGWGADQAPGTGRLQNAFTVWLRPTAPDAGPFAVRAAVAMVEELVAEGLSEDELALTRRYLEGRVALWAADPGRRLGWATEAAAMGWPDPIAALPEAVARVDKAAVDAALRAHLHPQDLRIVAVAADGAGLAAALADGVASPLAAAPGGPSLADARAAEARVAQDAAWAAHPLGLRRAAHLPAEDLFR
jgi:zinc protease